MSSETRTEQEVCDQIIADAKAKSDQKLRDAFQIGLLRQDLHAIEDRLRSLDLHARRLLEQQHIDDIGHVEKVISNLVTAVGNRMNQLTK